MKLQQLQKMRKVMDQIHRQQTTSHSTVNLYGISN